MTTLTREKIEALREAARKAVAEPWTLRLNPATILSLCDMAEAGQTDRVGDDEGSTRLSYSHVIAIVDDCVDRARERGESHRMLAKWISEGINAALSKAQEDGE